MDTVRESALAVRLWEKNPLPHRGTGTRVSIAPGFSVERGLFCQSQLPVKIPLQCPHSPPCAIVCINMCAHVKIPNIVSHILFFGHTKILYTQTGDGSAALAGSRCALPG